MLDFDGTVTEKGKYYPTQKMADLLFEITMKMPIAFCTGRQLESFWRRIHGLVEEISEDKRRDFLQNLYLMAENGAIGYYYDFDEDNYVEFYRAKWPEQFIERMEFMKEMASLIDDIGAVYDDAHRIVVVMRTNAHESGDHKVISEISQQIYERVVDYLEEKYPGYSEFLHIGNSGLGVVVGPADGDKDRGIEEFAKYLMKEKKMTFVEKYRDILVVGDSPQKGGNDYYFLNGRFGTPYTVESYNKDLEWPKPVIDHEGKRLHNSEGTEYLIKKFLI